MKGYYESPRPASADMGAGTVRSYLRITFTDRADAYAMTLRDAYLVVSGELDVSTKSPANVESVQIITEQDGREVAHYDVTVADLLALGKGAK